MIVIDDYRHCPPAAFGSVVALGNFDGVHLGHQKVIATAIGIAQSQSRPSAVLTFEPHPKSVLTPNVAPFRLTDRRMKIELMKDMGVSQLFIIPFNRAFSQITAEEFLSKILAKQLKAQHVVTGQDFIFGHERNGNASFLERHAPDHNIGYTRIASVGDAGNVFSSTRVRQYIREGQLNEAAMILGRNYRVSGIVARGDQRGRTLGFPTANVHLGDFTTPAYGVYAVHVTIKHAPVSLPAIANFGKRPTFDGADERLEIHIFDFNQDIYDNEVTVEFIRFIRPERQFASKETLIAAIAQDCHQAREILQ